MRVPPPLLAALVAFAPMASAMADDDRGTAMNAPEAGALDKAAWLTATLAPEPPCALLCGDTPPECPAGYECVAGETESDPAWCIRDERADQGLAQCMGIDAGM